MSRTIKLQRCDISLRRAVVAAGGVVDASGNVGAGVVVGMGVDDGVGVCAGIGVDTCVGFKQSQQIPVSGNCRSDIERGCCMCFLPRSANAICAERIFLASDEVFWA